MYFRSRGILSISSHQQRAFVTETHNPLQCWRRISAWLHPRISLAFVDSARGVQPFWKLNVFFCNHFYTSVRNRPFGLVVLDQNLLKSCFCSITSTRTVTEFTLWRYLWLFFSFFLARNNANQKYTVERFDVCIYIWQAIAFLDCWQWH